MNEPGDILLDLRDAYFGYGGRAVVCAEALELRAGRCLGIFGPNGGGKTTLVRGLTGLLPPLGGAVRRYQAVRCGFLPQAREIDPNWPMTGHDAAVLSASARSRFGWAGPTVRGRLATTMKQLGVVALANQRFDRLSGGQQQRVLLAGVLASDPQVLVLDEPADGLDVQARHDLLALLRGLAARGLCVVVVSHDAQDLLAICTEVAWLHAPVSRGEPSRVERIAPTALAHRIFNPGYAS